MTQTSTDLARAAVGLPPDQRAEQDRPRSVLDIKRDEMVGRITKYEGVFIDLFSDKLAGRRFLQDAYNSLRTTPQLALCTPESFMGGLVWAAQCRLRLASPFGHCWLIPFEDKKKHIYVATFVLGYKGVVTLGRRSGVAIMADTIYRNEKHRIARGLIEALEHEPILEAPTVEKLAELRGEPIIHYAIARASGTGLTAWRPLPHADALYARDHSKTYIANPAKSPWTEHLIPMCQKTGVHRLAPYIPTDSEELVISLQSDDSTQLIDNADEPSRVSLTRMSDDDAAVQEPEPEPEREVIDVQPPRDEQPAEEPAEAAQRSANAMSEPKIAMTAKRRALFKQLRERYPDDADAAGAALKYAARNNTLDISDDGLNYVDDDTIRAAIKADPVAVAAWQQDQAIEASNDDTPRSG